MTYVLGKASTLQAGLLLGARLMAVIHAAGIGFQVVRTWQGGRVQERRLKARHAPYRLCPLCCVDRLRQRRPRERRTR